MLFAGVELKTRLRTGKEKSHAIGKYKQVISYSLGTLFYRNVFVVSGGWGSGMLCWEVSYLPRCKFVLKATQYKEKSPFEG